MMPTNHHIFNRTVCCMLAIITFFALVFSYFAFIDGSFIRPVIKISELQTTKDTYEPGDYVYVRTSYCKYRNIPALVEWILINSQLHFYTPEVRNIVEIGCKEKILLPVEKLPNMIEPGKYHFAGNLTYPVNPIRKIVIPLRTNDFEVL